MHDRFRSLLAVCLALAATCSLGVQGIAHGLGRKVAAAESDAPNDIDTVVIALTKEGRGQANRTGRIVEFSGEFLRLAREGQRDELIPAARVVSFEIRWPEGYAAGRQQYQKRDYAAALDAYRAAAKAESREWVRGRLLARASDCYRELGQWQRAADLFLQLYAADSKTPELGIIPLRWSLQGATAGALHQAPLTPDEATQARQWLSQSENAAERLLGASWLLDTTNRDDALKVLTLLTKQGDLRLRPLAAAQLWRARFVARPAEDELANNLKTEELELWERQVGEMEEAVRAGPYWVIAAGWERLAQPQPAVWNFLRLPILYPDHHALVRAALEQSARQLDELGQGAAALRVRAELATFTER